MEPSDNNKVNVEYFYSAVDNLYNQEKNLETADLLIFLKNYSDFFDYSTIINGPRTFKKLKKICKIATSSEDQYLLQNPQLLKIKGIVERVELIKPFQEESLLHGPILTSIMSHIFSIEKLMRLSHVNEVFRSVAKLEMLNKINKNPHIPMKEMGLNGLKTLYGFVNTFGNELISLNLIGFEITDIQLVELIQKCPKINHISINSSKITNEALAVFSGMPLQSVNLSGCSGLTNEALAVFAGMPLQSVDLSGVGVRVGVRPDSLTVL